MGRMKWLARHVGFGQLRPKPCRFDQLCSRHMIGMRVDPIRREEPRWAYPAKNLGQLATRLQGRFQTSVGQVEVLAEIELQNFRCGGCFSCTNFRRTVRRRFAAG